MHTDRFTSLRAGDLSIRKIHLRNPPIVGATHRLHRGELMRSRLASETYTISVSISLQCSGAARQLAQYMALVVFSLFVIVTNTFASLFSG